jgi:hypothetical protein
MATLNARPIARGGMPSEFECERDQPDNHQNRQSEN